MNTLSLSPRMVRPHVPSFHSQHASYSPSQLVIRFGKDTCLAKHLLKEVLARYRNKALFPPPPNHTLCNLFNCGPTSLALVGLQVSGAMATTLLFLPCAFVFSFTCVFSSYYLALSHFFLLSLVESGVFSNSCPFCIEMMWAYWVFCISCRPSPLALDVLLSCFPQVLAGQAYWAFTLIFPSWTFSRPILIP